MDILYISERKATVLINSIKVKEIYRDKKIKRVTDENDATKLIRFEAETTDDDSDEAEVFFQPRGINHSLINQDNVQVAERPKRTLSTAKISADAWNKVKETEGNEWCLKAKQKKYEYIKSDEGREYLRQTCVDELRVISDVR